MGRGIGGFGEGVGGSKHQSLFNTINNTQSPGKATDSTKEKIQFMVTIIIDTI